MYLQKHFQLVFILKCFIFCITRLRDCCCCWLTLMQRKKILNLKLITFYSSLKSLITCMYIFFKNTMANFHLHHFKPSLNYKPNDNIMRLLLFIFVTVDNMPNMQLIILSMATNEHQTLLL